MEQYRIAERNGKVILIVKHAYFKKYLASQPIKDVIKDFITMCKIIKTKKIMFRKMILNYNSSSSQHEVVNTDHLVISHDDLFVQNPLVQRNKINKII